MRKLTLTLAGVLGLATLALGPALLGPAYPTQQAQARGEDPAAMEADWNKAWERKLNDCEKEYDKLRKWCDKNGLQWTGNRLYRRALDYMPDDPELRGFFGYDKLGGEWNQSDLMREKLRTEFMDVEDPNGPKLVKNIGSLQKKLAGWFESMAKKAEKNAEEDISAATKWKERANEAWMRVIKVPGNKKQVENAHKQLNHPKFGGVYVTPFTLRFMEQRTDRKLRGETLRAKDFEATNIPMEGLLVAAGFTGTAARSEHIEIHTTHPADLALECAKMAERAYEDAITVYGLPETIRERISIRRMHIVKDEEEFKKAAAASGLNAAQIQTYTDLNIGGITTGSNERILTERTAAGAYDGVMNVLISLSISRQARNLAIQDVGSPSGTDVEDWLWQSMGYDTTKRVLGTAHLVWAQFGKYGQRHKPRPGQDVWIELARMQVELDDDVALRRLYRLKISEAEFKGPEAVKAYAFFTYLFEMDPVRAQRFVWHAIAQGTPRAAYTVYGGDVLDPDKAGQDVEVSDPTGHTLPPVFKEVLDGLDAKYREWIMDSWTAAGADDE